MTREVIYGQDCMPVFANALETVTLDRGDIRYNKDAQKELYDFVGFVLSGKHTLAVFPKHYFTDEDLLLINTGDKILSEDIQLLFDVIYHYISTEKTSAIANKHFGRDPEYDADYPFSSFFAIYSYYRQFGIYQERTTRTVPGYNGRISWKDTIKKSSKIISDGNLVFAPLYVKENNARNVFISDCMVFVINYTLERFPYFLSLPRINYKSFDFDFFDNREYVLGQLRKAKNEVFKDIHRKLVQNLIDFFEFLDDALVGGSIHIKINYFDKVWEKMVHKYLNDYFLKIDEINKQLVFDDTQYSSAVNFNPVTFNVDESMHDFSITPDHYAVFHDDQYIFDSKYYDDISKLNYKQVAYYSLLSSKTIHSGKTHAALLLPGKEHSKLHFQLAKAFRTSINDCEIIEQYLCVKDVMKHYVSS